MLDATAGPDVGALYYPPPPPRPFLEEVGTDPGRLRIAFTAEPLLPGEVHEDCVKGLEETIQLCQELGHEMVEAAPQIDKQAFARAFQIMVFGETGAAIEEAEALLGRRATAHDFEPTTWVLGLLGKRIDAAEFSRAVHVIKNSARQVGPFFEEHDLLLTPTLARPPLKTGALQPRGTKLAAMKAAGRLNASRLLKFFAAFDTQADSVIAFVPYTPLFNATGQPAMSVPLCWNDEGLPIGMQFVGRYGDEATLFRLAGQLEEARPWFSRVPPIYVQGD
jgi:amidase